MQPARILFIDAYDSFSNSIIALLYRELPFVSVTAIKIDDPRFLLNDEAFFAYLSGFNAVVAGPGPGHPATPSDIGLIGRLWHQASESRVVPVLGICLGFQSLCLAFGGAIARLPLPRHGSIAAIRHAGEDVFAGTGEVEATLYHSLHVKLEEGTGSVNGERTLWRRAKPGKLRPLAWEVGCEVNGPTLMAVRHGTLPFWGVQYHPESVCTNGEGWKVVRNWWAEVQRWNAAAGWSLPAPVGGAVQMNGECSSPRSSVRSSMKQVQWQQMPLQPGFELMTLVDQLREQTSTQPFLLESGTRNGVPTRPETGRFTIIGSIDSNSLHLRYHTADRTIRLVQNGKTTHQTRSSVQGAFAAVDRLMKAERAVSGPQDSPFWGGLMGFVSYEAGLESIDVSPSAAVSNRPDLWFVFVERSIIIDHIKNVVYVQTLRADDLSWLDSTKLAITHSYQSQPPPIPDLIPGQLITAPDHTDYCSRVKHCQKYLHAGESYELCLTDQTTLRSATSPSSFYRHLRARNPAPFSSYFTLSDPTLTTTTLDVVSSSPERFLSWTRGSAGVCQFRPIKGTMKKGPAVTRAEVERVLKSEKEQAENLMIVDLIRHDLAGVRGVRGVEVPKLMGVEEYETVWQLVSVIEGKFEEDGARRNGKEDGEDEMATGIAALAASLPPGSMTGAPKKRSCELLRALEGVENPRGLYSGVIGYCDVGGGGDFAVVIRTAFRWSDEGEEDGVWRVGAGGAVTVLSEAQAEWDEMQVKRESVLASFALS